MELTNQFETDIDVYVPRNIVQEIQELADVCKVSYRLLQATEETFNVCITFEESKMQNIETFIENVNIIKQQLKTYGKD